MTVRVTTSNWIETKRNPTTPFFAITDVHGHLDHLKALHAKIAQIAAKSDKPYEVVHVGDYTDRGPESIATFKYLKKYQEEHNAGSKDKVIVLPGNHEQAMLCAINPAQNKQEQLKMLQWWCQIGGNMVFNEAGLPMNQGSINDLVKIVGSKVIKWIKGLPTAYRNGPFLFVHAGVPIGAKPIDVPSMPWRDLPDKPEEHPLWVRDGFLGNRKAWPNKEFVIHGHTPTDGKPEIKNNRINIDTGCFNTGKLTMLEHRKERYRFHVAYEK